MFDGKGLYLEVTPAGGKWWRFRYAFGGKSKLLSMGTYPEVSLTKARSGRDEARELLAESIDPSEHRKATKAMRAERDANSFEPVAREWYATMAPRRADSHGDKVIRRLERDVFPWIGGRPVGDVTAPELLTALRRIEGRGTVETALRRFRAVWALDFEYIARDGERPDPVCMVARELRSGAELRIWDADLRRGCPISWSADTVMISYFAPAELTCFRDLGWPMPENVIDLFAKWRTYTNGRDRVLGTSGNALLSALAYFGESHLSHEEKSGWRDRILAGRPYSLADRAGILDYCASDSEALRALLARLAARLWPRTHWLDHALLRGRFMAAVASMEHRGVPIDAPMLSRLVEHWEPIKRTLIDEIREAIPIFEGNTLKLALFERWLSERGIPWPRTETDRLSLSEDTFKAMARAYPEVAPIREVRDNLSKLRLTDLTVGRDGRNRAPLRPLAARSGRNAPSASRFIFGSSVWLRSLIKPGPGRALAYLDFSSQEIAIAAALSGDQAMMRAYESGDPYLSFAIDAGLAPTGATKATHKMIRERCKALVLGTLYGMRERTLAGNLNIDTAEARSLLRAHRRTYARFWDWSQAAVDAAMMRGYLDTCFGWRLHVTGATLSTSLLNHPMRSHGAEMLRLACSFIDEAGVELVAPVHDAVLIEAAAGELDDAVVEAQRIMGRASRIVLGGFEVRTDADVVRYPHRCSDERGLEMWDRVTRIVDILDADRKPMALVG